MSSPTCSTFGGHGRHYHNGLGFRLTPVCFVFIRRTTTPSLSPASRGKSRLWRSWSAGLMVSCPSALWERRAPAWGFPTLPSLFTILSDTLLIGQGTICRIMITVSLQRHHALVRLTDWQRDRLKHNVKPQLTIIFQYKNLPAYVVTWLRVASFMTFPLFCHYTHAAAMLQLCSFQQNHQGNTPILEVVPPKQ